MIETMKQDNIPFDQGNYQLIEYQDNYFINNTKKVKVKDIGKKVALTNAFFFDYLQEYHIPTAFLRKDGENALKFSNYQEFPFTVKILNSADKRNSKIFGLKEGDNLELPVLEFHYGNGKESIISESHLVSFNLCTPEEMKLITRICSKINAVLKSFFERRNEILAEINCHFGKFEEKVLFVGDFSPASLMIFPKDESVKWTNPYKLATGNDVKKYTEHLFKIASVK
jgi:phosphoribosylaminoimidazole-succinocarboxamide synthase